MCRKYRGKTSVINLSGSRTVNESPLGNQHTTSGSSLRSISISFRGNGFECPDPPGDDEAESAGEFLALPEAFRVDRLFAAVLSCSFNDAPSSPTGELDPEVAEVTLVLRCIFKRPLPREEFTGTTTGAPGAAGAEEDNIAEEDKTEELVAAGCCC